MIIFILGYLLYCIINSAYWTLYQYALYRGDIDKSCEAEKTTLDFQQQTGLGRLEVIAMTVLVPFLNLCFSIALVLDLINYLNSADFRNDEEL